MCDAQVGVVGQAAVAPPETSGAVCRQRGSNRVNECFSGWGQRCKICHNDLRAQSSIGSRAPSCLLCGYSDTQGDCVVWCVWTAVDVGFIPLHCSDLHRPSVHLKIKGCATMDTAGGAERAIHRYKPTVWPTAAKQVLGIRLHASAALAAHSNSQVVCAHVWRENAFVCGKER